MRNSKRMTLITEMGWGEAVTASVEKDVSFDDQDKSIPWYSGQSSLVVPCQNCGKRFLASIASHVCYFFSSIQVSWYFFHPHATVKKPGCFDHCASNSVACKVCVVFNALWVITFLTTEVEDGNHATISHQAASAPISILATFFLWWPTLAGPKLLGKWPLWWESIKEQISPHTTKLLLIVVNNQLSFVGEANIFYGRCTQKATENWPINAVNRHSTLFLTQYGNSAVFFPIQTSRNDNHLYDKFHHS